MRDGRVAPFILVAPRTNLLAGVDTGCANIPGTVNADTWLSVDVPKMVTGQLPRRRPPRPGWAVAGYSAGAHCAVKLAVAHPDRYRAAVSLSGYNDPIGERDSLAAQNPALRDANNPYLLLRAARTPPRIALYLSGQPHDGYEAAVTLEQSAKAPTTVHVVYMPRSAGGHTMALWRPQVVPAFRWLTQEWAWLRHVPPGPCRCSSRYSSRTVERRFHARGARQWYRIASSRRTKAVTTASAAGERAQGVVADAQDDHGGADDRRDRVQVAVPAQQRGHLVGEHVPQHTAADGGGQPQGRGRRSGRARTRTP